MLKIRLQRVGRKHETAFRLVLTDSKNSTKSGRFNEILGSYDPRKNTDQVKGERVKYWLEKGALATDSVHNFLIGHKVIDAKKRNVLPKKTVLVKEVTPEEPKAEAVVEAPKVEVAPDEPVQTVEEPATAEPEVAEQAAPIEKTLPTSEAVETPTEDVGAVEQTPTETPTTEKTEVLQ